MGIGTGYSPRAQLNPFHDQDPGTTARLNLSQLKAPMVTVPVSRHAEFPIDQTLPESAKQLGALIKDSHLLNFGLGDVWRFSLPDIKALCEHTDFAERVQMTFVGRTEHEQVRQRMEALRAVGARVNPFVKQEDLGKLIAKHGDSISAAFLTLPPDIHVSETKRLLSLLPEHAVVAIEKPLGFPNEMAEIREMLRGPNAKRLLNVDFYSAAKPTVWLCSTPQGRELLARFGTPVVINSFQMETMEVDRDRNGGDYGLLKAEKAGGGIFSADMGPHTIDIVANVLPHIVGQISQCKILNAQCHTYLPELLARTNADFRETFGVGQLEAFHKQGSTLINFAAGKGTGTDFFGMQMINDRGERLTISPGCHNQPFVMFEAHDPMQSFFGVFSGGGVGYDNTLIRILAHANNRDAKIFPEALGGMEAAIQAVELPFQAWQHFKAAGGIHEIYKFGEDPRTTIRPTLTLPVDVRLDK